jgi:hypothetical protein
MFQGNCAVFPGFSIARLPGAAPGGRARAVGGNLPGPWVRKNIRFAVEVWGTSCEADFGARFRCLSGGCGHAVRDRR